MCLGDNETINIVLPVVYSKLSGVILGVVFVLGEYVRKTRKVLCSLKLLRAQNVELNNNNITCYIDKVSSPLLMI